MRSARYRPLYRQFFWVFVIGCIGLGWLGSKPPEGGYVILARIFTVYYFASLPDHPAAARLDRDDRSRCRARSPKTCSSARRRDRGGRCWRSALGGLCSARLARRAAAAEDADTPPQAEMVVRRAVRQIRSRRSSSAASRSTTKSARPATACSCCRSAISPSRAARASRRRRPRRSPRNTRYKDSRTIRARWSSAPGRPADHFPPPVDQDVRGALQRRPIFR